MKDSEGYNVEDFRSDLKAILVKATASDDEVAKDLLPSLLAGFLTICDLMRLDQNTVEKLLLKTGESYKDVKTRLYRTGE